MPLDVAALTALIEAQFTVTPIGVLPVSTTITPTPQPDGKLSILAVPVLGPAFVDPMLAHAIASAVATAVVTHLITAATVVGVGPGFPATIK